MAVKSKLSLDAKNLISLSFMQEGQVVGHLGCGAGGFFALPFAQKVGKTGKVYAVDILQSALDATSKLAAKANLSNLEFALANLEKYGSTPIPPQSLDIAFLIGVLFQNKEWKNIIKEADRLVKTGGLLTVVEWAGDWKGFGPPDKMRVNPTEIKDTVLALGYQTISERELGEYHLGLVFKKIK